MPEDPNTVTVDQLRAGNLGPNNLIAPYSVRGDSTYIDPNTAEGRAITDYFRSENFALTFPVGGLLDPFFTPEQRLQYKGLLSSFGIGGSAAPRGSASYLGASSSAKSSSWLWWILIVLAVLVFFRLIR